MLMLTPPIIVDISYVVCLLRPRRHSMLIRCVLDVRAFLRVGLYLVRCPNLVLFACANVCCAGRPAPRYWAAREPPPRVPKAFQGSKCMGRVLQRGKYQVRAWPLHDIAITKSVGCMAQKRGFGGGRILRDGRAKVLQ